MSFREKIREFYYGLTAWKRAGLFLALIAMIGLGLLLVVSSVGDRLSRWSFLKSDAEKFQQAEQRADAADRRAQEIEGRLKEKEIQIATTEARAQAAEDALGAARNITVRTKVEYEEIRNRPIDSVRNLSTQQLCAELAGLGFACR